MATDAKGKQLPKGIRQRENGRFEVRVRRDGVTHSVYAGTLTEAKKKKNDLEYKLEHGFFVEKKKMTFDDWFNIWTTEYKENRVKKGTLDSYKRCYLYYLEKPFGKRNLSSIRSEHVQKLYNDLARDGYSISTISLVSSTLGNCLRQAERIRLIDQNPVDYAELPRKATEKQERQALTKEQQNLFMNYAEESYMYNLFAVMLRTGIRIGEATGLKISDIDKKARVIHIRRTLKYYGKDGFFEDTPKTKASLRDIPLTSETMGFIDRQRRSLNLKVEKMERYLFCDEKGGPFRRDRIQREINRITGRIRADGINFPKVTPHIFRHTFATRAIEAGMTPQTLKTILGHSSLSITMDLYSHVLPDTKEMEMEKIADAF